MLAAGSPTIQRVVKGELCSGCGLCASIAGGSMESTPSGYHRPAPAPPVDEETEKVLSAACPGAVVAPWQDAPQVDSYWGPYHEVLTGYSTDETVRYQSSSGGGITGLLLHALETGAVTGVIQTAADPERPTRNRLIVSRTREEVIAAAGSRYAASSPLEQISHLLTSNDRLAFVGKPCDCSALRQLGRFDTRVAERIPLVLSFFCAGVPSERGARNILREWGMPEEDLVAFRYRGFGWPGLTVGMTDDGRSATMTYEESWGNHLSKEVQFRCKICPDAVGGVADVACADAWYGGESGYPQFQEQSGRSLIISRTDTGQKLVRDAIAAGAIKAKTVAVRDVDLMQPSQARRKRLVRARVLALASTFQPITCMEGVMVNEAARSAPAGEAVKNFLGTLRRIFKGTR